MYKLWNVPASAADVVALIAVFVGETFMSAGRNSNTKGGPKKQAIARAVSAHIAVQRGCHASPVVKLH